MGDITDSSESDDEDEKRHLLLAREIARRQSEPAANFLSKNGAKRVSKCRSPPPLLSRDRQLSSSTEEDGEIIQEGRFRQPVP